MKTAMKTAMKTISEPTRCEQLGVCQAYGICTQCLTAAQRHPFAPGVIEHSHSSTRPTPRSFAVALWVLVVLALVTVGASLLMSLGVLGGFSNLWLLAA